TRGLRSDARRTAGARGGGPEDDCGEETQVAGRAYLQARRRAAGTSGSRRAEDYGQAAADSVALKRPHHAKSFFYSDLHRSPLGDTSVHQLDFAAPHYTFEFLRRSLRWAQ